MIRNKNLYIGFLNVVFVYIIDQTLPNESTDRFNRPITNNNNIISANQRTDGG